MTSAVRKLPRLIPATSTSFHFLRKLFPMDTILTSGSLIPGRQSGWSGFDTNVTRIHWKISARPSYNNDPIIHFYEKTFLAEYVDPNEKATFVRNTGAGRISLFGYDLLKSSEDGGLLIPPNDHSGWGHSRTAITKGKNKAKLACR